MAHEQEPRIIIAYVEEAHILVDKDADLDDTWPRTAKEGAAMNIGLVYCTQEPSSVHTSIIANTENFFVTRLNNDREVECIGKLFDVYPHPLRALNEEPQWEPAGQRIKVMYDDG